MILNLEIWNNLHDIFNSLAHHPQFCATGSDGISPAVKRFKLLSARVSTEISTSVAGSETPQDSADKIHLSNGGRLVALICGAEWPTVILVTTCKQFPVHRWRCSWSVGSTSIPSVHRVHLLVLRDAYSRPMQPDDSLAGDARLFKTE